MFQRKENESVFEYGLRLIEIKMEQNPDDLDWQDIIDLLGLDIHRDTLRKACQGEFGGYAVLKYFRNKNLANITDQDFFKELDIKKQEIKKELAKVQTEKVELNKWIKESARIELFGEKLIDAISTLSPIETPKYRINKNPINKEWVLTLADIHYGKEFTVKGLKGEILNKYSPEVFEQRMWNLLSECIEIIEKENITNLHLFNLSDTIEGILRVSQLQSLRFGIVESVMKFSEFLANWINELSKYVFIDYYFVLGNHNEIRVLNSKSGDMPHENTERLITWYLQTRLMNNQNVKIHDNDSNLYLAEIAGYNVLATHGQDDKDLEKSLKDYMIMYNEKINYLLTGHLHSNYLSTVGCTTDGNIEVIQSPSIMGIDEYSAKLKKSSKAGFKMLCFEQGKGKTITYDFILN